MTERNSNSGFTFDNVGKETPFRVPDGFFRQLESDIMRKAATTEPQAQPRRYRPTCRLIAGAAVTAAAAVALLISVNTSVTGARPDTGTPGGLSVEQAFNNLSQADQDYLIDTFRNDMIIDY